MSKNLVEILDGYKVGELKELAKTSGLKGYSKLKKAELMKEHGTGNRCRCSFFENGGIRP